MSQQTPIIIDPENEKVIAQLKKLATLLDNQFQIPGSNIRLGLDSLLGLVPGIGDGLGAALSFYLIYLSARTGVSKRVLTKMFLNVVVDSAVGVVPVLGDLFDIGWKSNQKNVQLALNDLELNYRHQRNNKEITRFLLICYGVFFFSIIVFVTFLIMTIIRLIF